MANLNFDSTGVQATSSFDAMPAGDYPAIVTNSEMKPTKKGDGQYLELTLELQGGAFSGRRVWDRLNLNNPNTTATEIAQKQLAALCNATGVLQVADSSQLHNIPILVKLSAKMDDFSGEVRNEVKGYKKLQSTAATPAFKAPTAAAPAANAGLPWAKK